MLQRAPGEGSGNPLQYSYLESSMNRGAQQAIVHEDKESDTTERLNTFKNHNLKGPQSGIQVIVRLHCNLNGSYMEVLRSELWLKPQDGVVPTYTVNQKTLDQLANLASPYGWIMDERKSWISFSFLKIMLHENSYKSFIIYICKCLLRVNTERLYC